MSAAERRIRSLCVVGAGIVGLSAALAFARALPWLKVRIVAAPADPAALADRSFSTLPAVHIFHAAIGLDELDLVRRGIAVHHLGTKFEQWSPDRSSWSHVYGEHGLPAATIPFHQIWGRLRRSAGAQAFDRYAAAACLAEAGKFVHPQDDPNSLLSTYLYGLRIEPERYRSCLAAEVERQSIEIVELGLRGIERRDDGAIHALELEDGTRIEADLYFDCAGPRAPLRSALDDDFEDWGDSLPCDRLAFASAREPGAPAPSDRVVALPDGWLWTSSLPGRTAMGGAWNAEVSNGQAIIEALRRLGADENVETVAICPGRRPEPWKQNVLAIGDSATAIDMLQGVNLHLAQSAILRALELIPGRDCHPLELREYNRRTGQETMRVRDFLALHYLRSGRRGDPFWEAASAGRIPESLAHSLDQYEARGRLPFYEEEVFDSESWLAVLSGLGILPRDTDPAAAGVDGEQAAESMARLAKQLAALPDRLPAYPDYLQRMRGSP